MQFELFAGRYQLQDPTGRGGMSTKHQAGERGSRDAFRAI